MIHPRRRSGISRRTHGVDRLLAQCEVLEPRVLLTTLDGETQWYRGNLHTHSLADGGNQFPEMVASYYLENDYQFLVLTEHDSILDDPNLFVDTRAGALPGFDEYKLKFPDQVDERTRIGVVGYDRFQDGIGTAIVGEDGSLRIVGNRWVSTVFDYDITPNTIFEFDFFSSQQGETHAIGFDDDRLTSIDRTFLLYGTEKFGYGKFNNYAETPNQVRHYRIPVGEFYTGAFRHLFFVSDHDVENPNAESIYSNIRVFEEGQEELQSPDFRVYETRIRTTAEIGEDLNVAGEFLLIPGSEISDRFIFRDDSRAPVHIVGTNLAENILPQRGGSVQATLQNNLAAIDEQSERLGRPIMSHVAHPNFGSGITAEELALVSTRFFEVYNGHPNVDNRGDDDKPSLDRLWDIANTIRIEQLGLPLLYGLGSDDAHNFLGDKANASAQPGRGWTTVRADELSVESLIEAMNRGDFYASSGVVLSDVVLSDDGIELEIEPQQGVTYTIEFIGTRSDVPLDGEPQRRDGEIIRGTRTYSDQIGEVFQTVIGTSASYTFSGDELYVRARITSSQLHPNPSQDGDVEMAWTQPVKGPGGLPPGAFGDGDEPGFNPIVSAEEESGDGVADVFELRLNNINLEVRVNGDLVQSTPFAFVNSITINGSDDDDTLTLNLAEGIPVPEFHVFFNGGGGNDTLGLINGNRRKIEYPMNSLADGSFQIDGSSIFHTGLETIRDELTNADRILTFNGLDENISLEDNDIASDGLSKLNFNSASPNLEFESRSGSMTLNLGDGNDTVNLLGSDALFSQALRIRGERGKDTIFATNFMHAVTLSGGGGMDNLRGGPGDDLILGGSGRDRMHGRGGKDSMLGGPGNDELYGGRGNDFLSGGGEPDTLHGGPGRDKLTGESGGDLLAGGAGRDTLFGGAGADRLSGGPGNDTLSGQGGVDRLFENADVDFVLTDTTLMGLGTDRISGIRLAELTISGDTGRTIDARQWTGRTRLTGGAGNDLLLGGLGSDSLKGGDGNDILVGFEGDDFLQGRNGSDTILGHSGNDRLLGGNDNDVVLGGDGDDVVFGQRGNDTIAGGEGNDNVNDTDIDIDEAFTIELNDLLNGFEGRGSRVEGRGSRD